MRTLFGVTGRRWLTEVELPVRKLTIRFWCMPRRGEDYAHQRPALTKKKLRERTRDHP